MPPRTVKRGAGPRRTGRVTRGSQKAQNHQPPDVPEDPVTVEEVPIRATEAKEDVKVEAEPTMEEKPPAIEEKPVVVNQLISDLNVEAKAEPNGLEKEDKMKESVDEYEKDERLDLEDNEPEYENEEYVGVDYDEKEIDQEDVQEVGDEGEEDPEENLGEEDEGDEEELEELEGEEYEEHAGEDHEHVEHADADEDEHHEVVKERRKRKEFEVFVGGLDKDATEGDLRKVFSAVGEVTEVRLMMNPQTKKNKGFAFLRFSTVEQAKRAVTELKNPVIKGKQCGVTPSQDSDTLFLGNICKTWSKEALKEKLKHYGVNNVEDVTLVEDSNNDGMNRGFAFLEFSSRSEAMDAFKRLQKRDVVFGVDRPAKVSFADSFIDPGDEIMAQVKTVFVDGLPATWDEDRVRWLLKKYGEIVKIELARNMPSAKRKDFGFVTFDTHDAAVTCAKSINNVELGEGGNKAKVRARLSRPLQKGKGRHVARGDFRSSRGSGRVVKGSWSHPSPRSLPMRGLRGAGSRIPPPSVKRPAGFRDRRPVMSVPVRARPLAPPARSYDRRAPAVSSYPKSSLKREYSRRDEILPPRSRAVADYGSRVVHERRPSYRDDYSSRASGYSDPPRSTSRTSARRAYVDDGYGPRFERPPPPPPPPSYREGRARDYDSVSGSKRPYSSMDDVPPRYADASVRQSRARLDYEYGSGGSHYGDAYGDRLGRSNLGYGSSRTSQDSHGLYSSRQGMGYGEGSYGGGDAGGMYSSSYGGEYISRGPDVGGSSYSSMYPGRGMGGSSYMGSGGSGSYY
ncbi:heterogeneous nuclear ribonucleoprotein Q isoform X1 [Morus notabilis]|uniref:heterogeneous nuclear ribonucleoprotein Q isoform X1 n=1 Tax=Morus notabilis TaxID=981085 RepID=UPI000CED3639|nr:heterogeneous nuclear ribonucleoprotein Q isoform X1 [Morus notabilis]XP_024016999.1 heterogeneous nuclear ribonucleoprotein Q isoform X1 [Morus notabilis]